MSPIALDPSQTVEVRLKPDDAVAFTVKFPTARERLKIIDLMERAGKSNVYTEIIPLRLEAAMVLVRSWRGLPPEVKSLDDALTAQELRDLVYAVLGATELKEVEIRNFQSSTPASAEKSAPAAEAPKPPEVAR